MLRAMEVSQGYSYFETWIIYLPGVEAHPGAIETHPGDMETHPGDMETHPGTMETHSIET
jgi:hypothetical protein